MSDSNELPEAESTPPHVHGNGDLEPRPEKHPSDPVDPCREDLTERLKRDREKYRVPAEVKEQILAELPPLEGARAVVSRVNGQRWFVG